MIDRSPLLQPAFPFPSIGAIIAMGRASELIPQLHSESQLIILIDLTRLQQPPHLARALPLCIFSCL